MLEGAERNRNFDSVAEDSSSKARANSATEKSLEERALLSEADYEARLRSIKAKAAEAESSREQRLASVGHWLIITVAIFSTLCFILSIIAIAIGWLRPSLLPPEAMSALMTVATFGFGIIIGNNLDRLFPRPKS